MKKNHLLNVAFWLCMTICILEAIMFLFITVILIHWHINPEYYNKFPLLVDALPKNIFGFGYSFHEQWWGEGVKHENQLTLAKIYPPSLYFIYIKMCALLFFIFLTFKEFGSIIRSVKLVQTFRTRNIGSFKRIAKYLLIAFLLSGFDIIYFKQGSFYGFYLNLTLLILMLVAYIMAEIFKEGNDLYEETQSIV